MFETKKFYIAGVQFRSARDKEALLNIKEGDYLTLEAEPDNKYDPNAVKIVDEGNSFHFGYVPKKFSSEVAGALDAGFDLQCKVTTLNANAKPWEACEVEIKEVSEAIYDEDLYDEPDGDPGELKENEDFAQDNLFERGDE